MESELPPRVDVVSQEKVRLAAVDGTTTVVLEPNVATSIPSSLLAMALAAGVKTVNGENSQMMSNEEVIEALKEAFTDILAAGDPALITANGEPRYASLRARCPDFTPEQRKQAWDEYLEETTSHEEPDTELAEDD